MAPQHAGLSEERWSAFSRDQQVLMIANEMNRGRALMAPEDLKRLRSCYERVLRLTDLTVRVQEGRGFRRELLRWRDLVAELYLEPGSNPAAHEAALRCLLRFTPQVSRQLGCLLAPS